MKTRIKHTMLLATIITLSAFTTSSTSKHWNIDQSHSSVNFSINHFFSAVTGKFKSFQGDFNFNPNHLSTSSFTFTVDVNSVDTDDEKRDNHLQSDNFFNAQKWPTMVFKSTSVEKSGDGLYNIHGQLTIRDVTKNVVLPMQVNGVIDNPWKENSVIMGITVKTTINRTDYGVGTGSWAATAVVGDEVDVNINMELDSEKD